MRPFDVTLVRVEPHFALTERAQGFALGIGFVADDHQLVVPGRGYLDAGLFWRLEALRHRTEKRGKTPLIRLT